MPIRNLSLRTKDINVNNLQNTNRNNNDLNSDLTHSLISNFGVDGGYGKNNIRQSFLMNN